jgi:hypothetical protein
MLQQGTGLGNASLRGLLIRRCFSVSRKRTWCGDGGGGEVVVVVVVVVR